MRTLVLSVAGAIMASGSAFAAQRTDARKDKHSVTSEVRLQF